MESYEFKNNLGLSQTWLPFVYSEVTIPAHVEKQYSTNQVESANNNMKDWLGGPKKLSFLVANRKKKEYVKAKQEFEMSTNASGPLEIAKGFDFLFKQRHIWNAMRADDLFQQL